MSDFPRTIKIDSANVSTVDRPAKYRFGNTS